MTNHRWTGTFLDGLKQQSDRHADEAFARILADGEQARIGQFFARLDTNDATAPADLFPQATEFIASTGKLPSWVELQRIQNGEATFWKHAYGIALVLLAKSLPEGYAAPNLSRILNMSGDLRARTYKRLLATLQLVLNVSSCTGFEPNGRAIISAQKLRLLHAGTRFVARRTLTDFEARYGVPVNQEDMLGTILGFSYLVILGLRTLEAGLTKQEEEDFLYTWKVFGIMMGIHPPGEPESTAYLPNDVADAEEFYRQYRRRHYVDASANSDGVLLGAADLALLTEMIPRPLRWLGFGIAPRIAMQDLMGPEACARIGISPVRGHRFVKWLIMAVHRVLAPRTPPTQHRLAKVIFGDMIKGAYGGEVTFTVPASLDDMRRMVTQPHPAHSGAASPLTHA
jgi:hypothetical protein